MRLPSQSYISCSASCLCTNTNDVSDTRNHWAKCFLSPLSSLATPYFRLRSVVTRGISSPSYAAIVSQIVRAVGHKSRLVLGRSSFGVRRPSHVNHEPLVHAIQLVWERLIKYFDVFQTVCFVATSHSACQTRFEDVLNRLEVYRLKKRALNASLSSLTRP